MNIHRRLLLGLVALPLATAAGPVRGKRDKKDKEVDKKAQKLRDQQEASAALQRGEILPLAGILDRIAQQVPGDVLEIELEREKTGFVYEIRVLTPEGRVRKLKADARDGRVLKLEHD